MEWIINRLKREIESLTIENAIMIGVVFGLLIDIFVNT